MNRSILTLVSILGLTLIGACSSDDKADPAPAVELASVVIASAPDTVEEGTFSLTGQTQCANNADSGLFQMVLTGANQTKLTVKIKGFSTAGATYTCTQASDNSDGDVGQKYDSCMVQWQGPFDADATYYNIYNMHRDEAAIESFTYAGACTIVTTYEKPKVSATLSCTNLIRTYRRTGAPNPLDTSATVTIQPESTFSCNL